MAGKRAGLDGERSGLFMEQIRIVKEMRERDRRTGMAGWLIRPRFMVWENVPGAFSSNKGKDFQAVLTEIVKIAEPDAPDVPMPDKGKWSHSGCLYDELGRWSVAWRLHDAQFWGVPQRRKRIALVADFGGLSAPEILFERKGLSRDSEPSGAEGEEASYTVEGSTDGAIFYDAYQHHGWRKSETSGTLTVGQNNTVRGDTPLITAYGICSYESNAMKSNNPHSGIYEADTSRTLDNNGGNPACNQGGMVVLEGNGSRPSHQGDGYIESDTMCTLNSTEVHAVLGTYQNVTDTLNPGAHPGSYNGQDAYNDMLIAAVDCRNATENSEVNGTLRAKEHGQNLNSNNVCRIGSTVRRLTPTECERLQGFPDGWTDIGEWVDSNGKKHKPADSPRYKALGNSIALPFWAWMARRICAQYERPMTMGSLFDGVGGFPLVFERAGAKAVWASEIEEFCVAVTKKHFPEEDT